MAVLWQQVCGGQRYEVRSAGKSRRMYVDGVLHSQHHSGRAVSGSVWDLLLLGAMAAADILAMGCYFALLVAALPARSRQRRGAECGCTSLCKLSHVERPPTEHKAYGQRALCIQIDRAIMHDDVGSKVLRGDKVDLEAVKAGVAQEEEIHIACVLGGRQSRAQRIHRSGREAEQHVRKLQRHAPEAAICNVRGDTLRLEVECGGGGGAPPSTGTGTDRHFPDGRARQRYGGCGGGRRGRRQGV